jgi:hypothetical protein
MARYGRAGGASVINDWMGALLWWPGYAGNRAEQSTLVRTAGDRPNTYSHADREWVDQVLAVHMGTNVIQRHHVPDAIAAGVRLEAIEGIRAGREEELTADERFLATFIREVVEGKLTDENWSRMEWRLGVRGAVEYTVFITLLWQTIRQYQAFGCEDPSDREIDELVLDIKEGRRPLPDWRKGIR